jgi:hypothetical protein
VDEFYFESGYVEAKYFVYVANATAGFTPYIAEGYLPADFFEDRGSFAAIFCDAEIVVGMLLEAQASLFGTFSINAGAQRFLTTSIALTSSFTQTAIGTRGKDTDLFAFSDAAISVQVSRIRGTNITASSVFSVAIDFVVERSADADVDAIFSAIINGLRSRDTITQTQAAFSFDVSANVITGVAATATVQSTVSIVAERLRGINSSQNSEFAQTTSGDRIRFGTVALSAASTVTATARKIRDAHLTGTGVAAINCIPNFTTNGSASIQSVGTIFFNGVLRTSTSANVSSIATFYAGRLIRAGRPRPYTQVGTPTLDTGSKKFGAASARLNYTNHITVPASADWSRIKTVDFWFNIPNPTEFDDLSGGLSHSVLTWYTDSNNNRSLNFQSQNQGIKFGIIGASYSARIAGVDYYHNLDFGSGISYNTWRHFRLLDDGSAITMWLDGVKQNPVAVNYTSAGIGFNQTLRIGHNPVFNPPTIRIDELLITRETLTSSATSTFTIPSDRWYPEDQTKILLLSHFDSNYTDDISEVMTPTLALSSNATVSAAVGYVATHQAAISASSSVVAVVGKLKEINLVAFDDAELSATATRIKSLASNLTSAISVSANAVKTTDTQSNIESVVSLSTAISANRNAVITTQAISSQLSAVVRLAGLFADDLCEFNLTTVGVRTASAQSSLQSQSQTTVTAFRIKQLSSALESSATLAVDAVVAKVAAGSFNSNFAQTTSGDRIRFFAMSVVSNSQVSATGNNLGKIECTLFNAVTLSATAMKIVGVASTLPATVATVNVIANRIQNAASAVTSNSNVSVSGQSVITASAILPSIVIQMSVVMEIAGLGSAMNVTASMVTTVSVIKSIQASANTSVSVIAIVGYRVTAASAITSASSITFLAGNLLSAQMVITSAMTFTASVREIRIDEIVYVIPGEIFEFEISSETRQYTIGSETRKYIITQGE